MKSMLMAGNINDIVSIYFTSNKLNILCSWCKFSDVETQKDFIQELIIILLEYKDKEKLIGMHERGELGFFIMRIIQIQYMSKTSTWYKKYGEYIENKTEIDPERT